MPLDLFSDSERSEDELESYNLFHEEDLDGNESGETHHFHSGLHWQGSQANWEAWSRFSDHLPSRKREGSISLIRQDSVESLISSKHKRSVNDIMETLLGPFQINDPKLVRL